MILLSQAQSDRTILAKQLSISEHQLSISHMFRRGLFTVKCNHSVCGSSFPRGEIYDLLTTAGGYEE